MKKVLITGSDGFIAKNLVEHLKIDKNIKLYLYNKSDSLSILDAYINEADFIFHLAGVNRPKVNNEFYEGNTELTRYIINKLKILDRKVPILFPSSIQAELDNDYGQSKLKAEKIIIEYSKKQDVEVFIYRLPNTFGKWAKPNYNSVIATWCHNITNNLDIVINNENTELKLVYIDDVILSFIGKLMSHDKSIYFSVDRIYYKTLKEIKELLNKFKDNRSTLVIPNVASGFERALYSTYLSYLPSDKFAYELKGHKDERGTFYEILKTIDSGQFSLSTTAPGVTRGNHYHHTKNEKFLVVKGEATIQFRHIVTNKVIEYKVDDSKMEIVEMIPGYTHNIKNTGNEEMILFLWANESFNPKKPDTYFLEV